MKLADNAGGAGGFGGDAYPAQEPEATERRPDQADWTDKANVEDYRFFYGNGQFHISEDHEFDDLASHAGVNPDHAGPMAIGRVHVDLGKATFEVQSNINAQGIARILKDYCDKAGWRWGGMTDLQGEPIGTGSEFAPVKSYYFRQTPGGLLISRKANFVSDGAVHVEDKKAYLVGASSIHWEAIREWSQDNHLLLLGANDNVLKRIEDLEIDNNYTPEWKNDSDHHLFQNEPDQRQPGGVYKCPACSQIFPSYRLYLQHRSEEDPITDKNDWVDDGKFPDLDMDATFPPNVSEPMKMAAVDWKHPMKIVKTEPGQQDMASFGWRVPIVYDQNSNRLGVGNPGDYHHDVATGLGYDRFKSWSPGLHDGWVSIDHQPQYSDEPTAPELGLRMRSHPSVIPKIQEALRAEYPQVDNHLQQDEDTDMLDWDIITGSTTQLPLGWPWKPGTRVVTRLGMEGTVYAIDPNSQRVTIKVDGRQPPYDMMEVMAPSLKVAANDPKDLLAAPIPFLYDIDTDAIYVGQPGQRTSDIPGKFTPGGIVEGTYEPGGKVIMRSMTNMPYTVRHLLELWYYQHPEMEVKSVQMQDEAGNTTKLAAQDVGGYISAMTAADPVAFRAYKALSARGGKVFVVGGAVRDALLGKEPKDIDLMVTGLPPDDVESVLNTLAKTNNGGTKLTGKDFGVFRYHEKGHEIEIAMPRRERSTGDGHKDFSVQADHTMTPEEDLFRRDFTVNAMAVDLDTGKLIDPFHGADDIKNRTLRTLNTKSLSDDPLRTVRGFAAEARHGLIPNRDTLDQMAENASAIKHLPAERIQEELDKIMASDNPEAAIRRAHEVGALEHILPEVDRAFGHSQNNPHHELELGDHLINVMKRAKERKPEDADFALAGLLHDIGKVDSHWTECRDCGWKDNGHHIPCPNCNSDNTSGHFYQLDDKIGKNHEDVGADQAYSRLFGELNFPKDRAERIRDLIQHHMFGAFTAEKGARKFMNQVGNHANDLLDLRWADQGGKSEYPTDPSLNVDTQRQLLEQVRQKNQPTDKSMLAINGRDLIDAGVQPGPAMGQLIQRLTDAVIENPELNTKDGLLGLVRAWNGQ